MTREQELAGDGWTRKTTMNEPRLSEVVEEYRSLGFEVLLEPIDKAHCNEAGCSSCFEIEGVAEQFRTVYTRPGKNAGGDDELF